MVVETMPSELDELLKELEEQSNNVGEYRLIDGTLFYVIPKKNCQRFYAALKRRNEKEREK